MSPKRIKELTDKKHRSETGLFLVEGYKNIEELLDSDFELVHIVGTRPFLNVISDRINAYGERTSKKVTVQEVKEEELVKIGTLLSNNAGIAVARQKTAPTLEALLTEAEHNIVVVLDDIRDPGNFGTIMRTSDWYGVTHIAASPTTTDLYNPKVIAASMGSFTRMQVTYISLEEFLEAAQAKSIPIIAADLTGENAHTATLPSQGILLMGSESHGVSKESLARATHQVMIPRFGKAESLNVGTATAILLDTLRRNTNS
jgi:RNA methyltransferase, TrmH family